MSNKTGAIAAAFPAAANVSAELYTPATGNKFTGALRVSNQSGTLQSFRYAITPDATPPSDVAPDINWYAYDLPIDNVPFTEGINVGAGQHVWIRATSVLVAFQLNGRENLDS